MNAQSVRAHPSRFGQDAADRIASGFTIAGMSKQVLHGAIMEGNIEGAVAVRREVTGEAVHVHPPNALEGVGCDRDFHYVSSVKNVEAYLHVQNSQQHFEDSAA